MKRLRRMAAALALATAATTGALITGTAHASAAGDTAWGTPATITEPEAPAPGPGPVVITPLDTAWG